MKNLFLVSFVLISTNLFASSMLTLKTLSNQSLNSASSELVATELVTHSTLKKVTELKGKAKTAQELRMNAVAQALHTVCPFFDDGVRININTKDDKGTLNAVKDLADSSNVNEGDAEFKAITRIVSIINKQADVELYSGSASGNNTAGTVLGFYDLKNNEIGVFANTNCGSDN